MSIFSPDKATPNDAPGFGPESLALGRSAELSAAINKLLPAADRVMEASASNQTNAVGAIMEAAFNSAIQEDPKRVYQPRRLVAQELSTEGVIIEDEANLQSVAFDSDSSEARQMRARATLVELQGPPVPQVPQGETHGFQKVTQ